MLESFVITLREGLEAALAVGIALAYLARSGRSALRGYVFAGLAAGVLASAGGALLFRALPLNQDAFEGWVMLAAAALVGSTTIFMMRAAKALKSDIEGRVEHAVRRPSAAAGWALFLVTLFLVLREGVETVLFLTAVSLNTSALSNFLAGLLGLCAAGFLGYLFMTSGLRAHLGRFFRVTAGLLGLMVLQLTVAGLHELSEAGVLPSSRTEMRIVGPLVHNDTLLFLAMIGLAAALMLWPSAPRQAPAAPESARSEPERRKQLKERRRADRVRRTAAALCLALIALVGTGYVSSKVEEAPPPAERAEAAGDALQIPLSALADGRVHWFAQPIGGVTVRFLLALNGGDLRTGLDACSICGASGYRAKDRQVVCRNCGAEVLISNIGSQGGCTPLPLHVARQGEHILVPLSQLAAERSRFASSQEELGVDPVCGMKLTAQNSGPAVTWRGRVVQLCRMEECRRQFAAHPERYAKP